MAGQLEVRRGTTANRLAITFLNGEFAWDTTLNALFVGDGVTPGGILVGPGGQPRTLTKTANYTVVASDSGTHFNNIGATGNIVLTLPAALVGMNFAGIVVAAFELRWTANGGDLFKSDVFSGGSLGSSTPYATLSFECPQNGTWVVMAATGAWS